MSLYINKVKNPNGVNSNTQGANSKVQSFDEKLKNTSIFKMPNPNQSSGNAGGRASAGLEATADAKSKASKGETDTKSANNATKQANTSTKQMEVQERTIQMQSKDAITKLTRDTNKIGSLNQKAAKTDEEIKSLQQEKDALTGNNSASAPSNTSNPFEKVFSLSLPGGDSNKTDNQQQQDSGTLLTQNNKNSQGTKNDESQDPETQEKIQKLEDQIQNKTTDKNQTMKTSKTTSKQLGIEMKQINQKFNLEKYKAQIKETEANGLLETGNNTIKVGDGISAFGKGVNFSGKGTEAAGHAPYMQALIPVGRGMQTEGTITDKVGLGVKVAGTAETIAAKAKIEGAKKLQTKISNERKLVIAKQVEAYKKISSNGKA